MEEYIAPLLRSALFIGLFILATYLGIPKTIHFWELWKKTRKPIHLSNAIGSAVLTFFLYSTDFAIMIMRLGGWGSY